MTTDSNTYNFQGILLALNVLSNDNQLRQIHLLDQEIEHLLVGLFNNCRICHRHDVTTSWLLTIRSLIHDLCDTHFTTSPDDITHTHRHVHTHTKGFTTFRSSSLYIVQSLHCTELALLKGVGSMNFSVTCVGIAIPLFLLPLQICGLPSTTQLAPRSHLT